MKKLLPFFFLAFLTLIPGCGENNTGGGNGNGPGGNGGRNNGGNGGNNTTETVDLSLSIDTLTCKIKIKNEKSRDEYCKKIRAAACDARTKEVHLKSGGCI